MDFEKGAEIALGWNAPGKFVHVELANDGGPRGLPVCDQGGILMGDAVLRNPGVPCSGEALRGDHVFETDGDAVKESSLLSMTHSRIGLPRGLQGPFGRNMDEAAQAAIY